MRFANRRFSCLVSGLLAVSVSTAPLFATAAPLDDLMQINREYSIQYFSWLKAKRTTRAGVKALNDEKATFQSDLDRATRNFNAQNVRYLAAQGAVDSANLTVSTNETAIANAEQRLEFQKSEALRKGYFTAEETVDARTTAAKLGVRNTELGNANTEIERKNGEISRIQRSPDYRRLQASARDTAAEVTRLQEVVRAGEARKIVLDRAIEDAQEEVDRLALEIQGFEDRRAQLFLRVIPQQGDRVREIQGNLDRAKARVTELQTQIDTKTAELPDLRKKLAEVTARKTQVEARLAEMQLELKGYDDTLKSAPALATEKTNLETVTIPDAEKNLKDAKKARKQAEEALVAPLAALAAVDAKIAVNVAALPALQTAKEKADRELKDLVSELARLNEVLAGEQALLDRQSEINEKIPAAQAASDEAEAAKTGAETAKTTAETALNAALSALEELENRKSELEGGIANLNVQIETANSNLTALESEKTTAAETRAAREALETQRDSLAGSVSSAQTAFDQAQTAADTAAAQYEAIETEVGDNPDRQQEVEDARVASEQAQAILAGAQADLAQAQTDLATAQAQLDALPTARADADIQADINAVRDEVIPALEESLSSKSKDLAEVQQSIDEDTSVANARAALTAAETALETAAADAETKAADLKTLNDDLKTVSADIAALKTASERRDAINGGLMTAAEATATAAAAAVTKNGEDKTALDGERTAAAEALKPFVSAKATADEAVTQAQAAFDTLDTRLKEVKRLIADMGKTQEKRDALAPKVEEKVKQVEGVVAEFNQATAKVNNVTAKIGELNTQIGEARDREGEVQTRFDRQNALLLALQAELKQIDDVELKNRRESQTAWKTARDTASTERVDVTSAVSTAQIALPEAIRSSSTATANFNRYYLQNIRPLETRVAELNDTVTRLTREIGDLTTLASTIREVPRTIETATAAINEAQARLPRLREAVLALEPELNRLRAVLAPLEARASGIEAAKVRLLAELDGIYQVLKGYELQIDTIVRNDLGGR